MKKIPAVIAIALLPLMASASVSVEWVQPENFRDAYYSNVKSDKSLHIVLDDLEKFITEKASAKLEEGQNLDIRVTDLDLSGEFDTNLGGDKNIRIIKSPYYGRIVFSYTLTDAEGNVLKQGDKTLVNKLLIAPDLPYRDEIAPYLRSSLSAWINETL